jgi:hypothetical protein
MREGNGSEAKRRLHKMTIMLSELQQKSVWEGWLSSEIRENYFADLCHCYQRRQRFINWLILALSSSAFVALISAWLPPGLGWLTPTLAALTAVLSGWSLVAQNQKQSTDCSDLSFRWSRLSGEYQALWDDMYSPDAALRLRKLMERETELSKSGHSFPNKQNLMEKWEDHVVRHHTAAA